MNMVESKNFYMKVRKASSESLMPELKQASRRVAKETGKRTLLMHEYALVYQQAHDTGMW